MLSRLQARKACILNLSYWRNITISCGSNSFWPQRPYLLPSHVFLFSINYAPKRGLRMDLINARLRQDQKAVGTRDRPPSRLTSGSSILPSSIPPCHNYDILYSTPLVVSITSNDARSHSLAHPRSLFCSAIAQRGSSAQWGSPDRHDVICTHRSAELPWRDTKFDLRS